MYEFLLWLQGKMTTPTNYSWFHIMFLVITVGVTVLLCLFFKDSDEKTFRRIILIAWIIIVVFEIYKEVIFSFNYDSENHWEYQWYSFPFQMCSTPFYVLPFIAFLPRGKFQKVSDAFMSYTSFYAFFAGLCVMLYPNDVFISTIGINIQTMIHHGSQVALGIFVSVWNRKRFGISYFLKGIIVFVGCIAVAFILNVTVPNFVEGTFNMFYIGPKYPSTLPVLSMIYPKVPYVVFLAIYIFGFTLASFIVFGVEYLIFNKGFKRKNANA